MDGQGRLAVLHEDPLGAPLGHRASGFAVGAAVVAADLGRQVDAHGVVRVAGEQLGPLPRAHDVVGRCQHGREVDARRVEAEGAKGSQMGTGAW